MVVGKMIELVDPDWRSNISGLRFPHEAAPGLWILGNYFFNLYLAQGEQASILIEAGVSAIADSVKDQLEKTAITPTFLVVTHPHADHVTGIDAFREFYPHIIIIAGKGAPEFLAHPKAGKSIAVEDQHMSEFLRSQGVIPGRIPVTEGPTLENCLIAADGDEMDLGGLTVRFLEVKGHSPGKIVVHIPEKRALLVSDSLGFRYPGRGFLPLFLTNRADYMDALARLEGLSPEFVGLAHQGYLVGRDAAEAFAQAGLQAQQLIKAIQEDQRSEEDLVIDLFQKYYRDELLLYTEENIMNCLRLIVKRARDQEEDSS
jgi:glyoxylase-like metal-dependent hydrolase (beta-lactamase superfamily II)